MTPISNKTDILVGQYEPMRLGFFHQVDPCFYFKVNAQLAKNLSPIDAGASAFYLLHEIILPLGEQK